jgi:hypothetical protein
MNDPIFIRQKEIEKELYQFLIVPDKLKNACSMIITANERLLKYKAHYGPEIRLLGTHSGELDIEVSQPNINRALLFMDTFIKLIEARGHKLVETNGTYIQIGNVKLEISLKEKRNRRIVKDKSNWTTAEFTPSGVLSFKMREGSYRIIEWKDGKARIEKQLSNILSTLEIKADEIKEKEIESAKWRIEKEKERKVAELLKLQKSKEIAKFKELLNQVRRWHEAKLIREYIDAVKGEAVSGIDIQDWAEWGKRKADWYDPTLNVTDDLLEGIDKSSLQLPPTAFY